MSNREIRTIKPVDLAVRKLDTGETVLTGYAIVWDSLSEDLGGFREIIRKGATAQVVAGPDNIFATLDHELEVANILGSRDNQTLKLWEDDRGLAFEVTTPNTTRAKDAIENVSNGNVKGVSFAFYVARDNWIQNPDGSKVREVLEFAGLDEISIVVRPAYPATNVEVAKRSLEQWENAVETAKQTILWEAARKAGRPTVDYLTRELDLMLYRSFNGNASRQVAFSRAVRQRE